MAITLNTSGSNFQNQNTNSCSFNVVSSGLTAMISVSYLPSNSQEISNVKINTQDCIQAIKSQQGISIATSVWYKTNLEIGQNNIDVQFEDSTVSIINYLVYDGVNLNTPIYKTTSAAGKQVIELPFKSFSKTSGLAIGFGSVNNETSHIENLFGNQFIAYRTVSSGNGISSEAIAAYGLFDRDSISVPNTLNHPADWSIVIVGLEAQ